MTASPDSRPERARLAHDLSQPVQAIELYASALERRVDTDEARQLVLKIRDAVSEIRNRISALEK